MQYVSCQYLLSSLLYAASLASLCTHVLVKSSMHIYLIHVCLGGNVHQCLYINVCIDKQLNMNVHAHTSLEFSNIILAILHFKQRKKKKKKQQKKEKKLFICSLSDFFLFFYLWIFLFSTSILIYLKFCLWFVSASNDRSCLPNSQLFNKILFY